MLIIFLILLYDYCSYRINYDVSDCFIETMLVFLVEVHEYNFARATAQTITKNCSFFLFIQQFLL